MKLTVHSFIDENCFQKWSSVKKVQTIIYNIITGCWHDHVSIQWQFNSGPINEDVDNLKLAIKCRWQTFSYHDRWHKIWRLSRHHQPRHRHYRYSTPINQIYKRIWIQLKLKQQHISNLWSCLHVHSITTSFFMSFTLLYVSMFFDCFISCC